MKSVAHLEGVPHFLTYKLNLKIISGMVLEISKSVCKYCFQN